MKPLAVLLIVFAPLLVRPAGQEFVLSAGQSIVFKFDTLPMVSSERGDSSDIDLVSYSLTDPWVDNFRLEVFETSLDEAPRYVVTKREFNEPFKSGPENSTSCGGTNLWQDLQGGARLTVLAGSVRFQQPGVDVVTPSGRYGIDFVFLNILRSGPEIKLSWPYTINTDTYAVQETASLNASNWATVTNERVLTNGRFMVTLPLTNAPRFFRLTSP